MTRRWLWGLLLLPVLAVGADALLWRAAERQLRTGLTQWMTERRAQGWTVNAGPAVSGGWPLAATLTVPDMFLTGGEPDLPGGLTWSAAQIELRVSLWQPRRLVVAALGQQNLRVGDSPDIPFSADRLEAAFPLQPNVPARSLTLVFDHLRAGLGGAGAPAASVTVAAGQMRLVAKPAAPQGEAALSFDLHASDIVLPGNVTWPLGGTVASAALTGAVNGPVPLVPGLPARLAAWRDGGGALEVQHLGLDWGPLRVNATATMAVDDKLQPMGAGTAKLTGLSPALDAMAQAGVVKPQMATAAKAVLTLMSRPAPNGGEPETDLPLTLQDRRLLMGRIPLLRLPEIDWSTQ